MSGQHNLFGDDQTPDPQPASTPTPEEFEEDRTYRLPLEDIQIPTWHPRIRPPHPEQSPELERIVQGILLHRDLCEPLIVRREAGAVELVTGLLRYWALEEAGRREGKPMMAPVRFHNVSLRRAMAMAAALNTGLKWGALAEGWYAVRMHAEMRQEEEREVTVRELAAELPWSGGKTSQRLTIGRAFPVAFLEANSFSVHDVNALAGTFLLSVARRSPDARVDALRDEIEGHQRRGSAPGGRRRRPKFTLKGSDRGGVEILRCPDPYVLSAAEAGEVLDILEPLVERLRSRLDDAREDRAREAA
jgi:hypothetical protein